MGLFSKKVSCLGLDIGEQSIIVMGLRKATQGYEITEFQNLSEAAAAVGNSSVMSDGTHVVAAVSGENVIVRNLTLPVMPDSELAEAVRYEAEASLPLPAKEVTIDFIKYGVITDGGIRKQEVLVVAVRNDAVKKLLAASAAAGFMPDTVDIEPLVLQRAVSKLTPGGVPGQTSYAIVHIGSQSTNISIFRDNCLFFTRTLYTGEHKLVTDIERSLEYYLAEHRGQEVAKLFVTGRGARLNGLDEYISSRLDIPVEVFNPAEYLYINPKIKHTTEDVRNAGTALTQVVGLALSEVD